MIKRLFLAIALLCSACCWANTPPTLSASAFLAAGTGTRSFTSVSWAANDIVIVAGVDEGSTTESFNTPTGSGLTFTSVINHAASSNCAMAIYKATPSSSGSVAISWSMTVSGDVWNGGVYVWHNSNGVGGNTSQFTSTKTVSFTPTGGADSAIIWVVGDFNAGASPAATPTSPNETTDQATQDGTVYSFVTAHITDQTSSGAVSYGLTGGSTSGPFSIGVIEIEGTTGGGSTPTGFNKQRRYEQVDQ